MSVLIRCCCAVDCTGCSGSHDFATIDLIMDELTWVSRSLDSTCSDTNSAGTAFTIRTRFVDITGVGSCTLYRRPDGAAQEFISFPLDTDTECAWLWSDPRIAEYVWHHENPGFCAVAIDNSVVYTPLNASDPSNPWNRVTLPNDDTRCDTSACPGGGLPATHRFWQCSNSTFGWWISLEIVDGPDTGTEWAFSSGGTRKWWLLRIWCIIERSGTYEPSGLGYELAAPGSSLGEPCAPYAYYDTGDGTMTNGGAILIYAKPVDCETDFDCPGTITIPLNTLFSDRADYLDITYPSSVEINLCG